MKTNFKSLLTVILIFFGVHLSAQSIYFCESVDDKGFPVNESNSFTISGNGGYFYFLVRLDEESGCEEVFYDIYNVDENGNKIFNTSITQDEMSPDWTYFYKQVTFYEAGSYYIEVQDCIGDYVTSGYLNVHF